MRVLLFPKEFPSAERPGAGIFILRRAQALRDLGHDVAVIRVVPLAPRAGTRWKAYAAIPRDDEVDGIPVHTIRALMPPRMIGMEYLHLQVLPQLRRAVARMRPDIVHASFLIPNGQIAARLTPRAIVTAHGSDAYSWPQRRAGLLRAARDAVRHCARVTAVSGYIADRVRAIWPRDVDVIWNGGDERFFFPRDRASARRTLGLPPDRRIVAFAGNLLEAKGVFDLVDAAARLADVQPLIVMAGAGPAKAEIERRARDARVDVRLVGTLQPSALGELFSAADVVTLPSYAEGLPNVVCEAMLSQRAVVASTAGGTPEIVHDEDDGLLVTPGDAPALAQALRRVLTQDALRASLEDRARAFAAANLTWRVSAQKYERVYREILSAS